jgi:hypothetical protein
MQDRAERRAIVELARLGSARHTAEFPRRVEVDDQRGRRSPRAQLRESAARKFVRTARRYRTIQIRVGRHTLTA